MNSYYKIDLGGYATLNPPIVRYRNVGCSTATMSPSGLVIAEYLDLNSTSTKEIQEEPYVRKRFLRPIRK